MTDTDKDIGSGKRHRSGCLAVGSLAALVVLIFFPLLIVAVAFRNELAFWLANHWADLSGQAPNSSQTFAQSLIEERFPAVVGLPFAAALALVLVLVLRISTGPIEFEAFGLKLKGAAGPIIFWVICFLAIAGAIKLLW